MDRSVEDVKQERVDGRIGVCRLKNVRVKEQTIQGNVPRSGGLAIESRPRQSKQATGREQGLGLERRDKMISVVETLWKENRMLRELKSQKTQQWSN